MQTILNELFDHYNRFAPETEPLQDIESTSIPKARTQAGATYHRQQRLNCRCFCQRKFPVRILAGMADTLTTAHIR